MSSVQPVVTFYGKQHVFVPDDDEPDVLHCSLCSLRASALHYDGLACNTADCFGGRFKESTCKPCSPVVSKASFEFTKIYEANNELQEAGEFDLGHSIVLIEKYLTDPEYKQYVQLKKKFG